MVYRKIRTEPVAPRREPYFCGVHDVREHSDTVDHKRRRLGVDDATPVSGAG